MCRDWWRTLQYRIASNVEGDAINIVGRFSLIPVLAKWGLNSAASEVKRREARGRHLLVTGSALRVCGKYDRINQSNQIHLIRAVNKQSRTHKYSPHSNSANFWRWMWEAIENLITRLMAADSPCKRFEPIGPHSDRTVSQFALGSLENSSNRLARRRRQPKMFP